MTTERATQRNAQAESTARGHTARGVNVGAEERMFSVLGGVALGLYGLARIRLSGLVLAGLGGALLSRGLSGHCRFYAALGLGRAATLTGETRGNRGIKIQREVAVNAQPEMLHRLWRQLEDLPRFMSHLARVEQIDDQRSRWTLKTPPGVPAIAWEAEIINDRPGELIAWETTGGSVDHAGSVSFERAPDGRSTVVRVELQYDPPGGEIAHALATLFGRDAGSQIAADLRELKRAVEAGEMSSSTISGRRVS